MALLACAVAGMDDAFHDTEESLDTILEQYGYKDAVEPKPVDITQVQVETPGGSQSQEVDVTNPVHLAQLVADTEDDSFGQADNAVAGKGGSSLTIKQVRQKYKRKLKQERQRLLDDFEARMESLGNDRELKAARGEHARARAGAWWAWV